MMRLLTVGTSCSRWLFVFEFVQTFLGRVAAAADSTGFKSCATALVVSKFLASKASKWLWCVGFSRKGSPDVEGDFVRDGSFEGSKNLLSRSS